MIFRVDNGGLLACYFHEWLLCFWLICFILIFYFLLRYLDSGITAVALDPNPEKIAREYHLKVQKSEGKNRIKISIHCFTLWYLFRVYDFSVYIPSIDSWRREEMHVLEWLKWKVTGGMYFSSCSRSNLFF